MINNMFLLLQVLGYQGILENLSKNIDGYILTEGNLV
jgi:hypothetical protein